MFRVVVFLVGCHRPERHQSVLQQIDHAECCHPSVIILNLCSRMSYRLYIVVD